MKTSESIKECLKEMLIDLGTDNLEYLSGIADYNYANSKEKSLDTIYLFTHFILTEVMDGTEVRPTLENMFKAYKN